MFNPSGQDRLGAYIKLNPICAGTSSLLMHELSFQDGFFKVNASNWDIFHSDITQMELIPGIEWINHLNPIWRWHMDGGQESWEIVKE